MHGEGFVINSMKMVYTELNSQRQHTRKHLRAGIALPIFNRPVKIEKDYYFDGGLVDNIPVYPLMQYNLDYIICIHFDDYNYTFESKYFDNKIVKINFTGDSKHSIWFNRSDVKEMEIQGYKKAKAIMEFVFADGLENTEAIYGKIEALNAMNSHKVRRTTSDIINDNFDKLKKRLAKRKIVE